ncbi:MAG: sulfonate transporter substrate-binding protein [Actinomycetia bacterium]|nr:sulfonate transporter substrate-binding protein [Actinomycetes bacterium]
MHRRRPLVATVLVLATLLLVACGSDGGSDGKASSGSSTTAAEKPTTLRLGYFPNVTHATAIVGVEKGIFQEHLGNDTLKVSTFNAGSEASTALLAGAIDASYIGPNPAISAWAKSKAIKIVSGATSGGAALVVKPAITGAGQLKGKKLATPQLGNTQDVALRSWLDEQGLKTDTNGGGDVSIIPQDNSRTLDAFKQGTIDGAWVPEPWATRLVQEGGGKVLVNEKDLWPDGQFVTTHLIVTTKFLDAHPTTIKHLLEGQVEANQWVNDNTDEAQAVVNAGIEKITGKKLGDAVIKAAWANLEFTNDPIASSLKTSADHAIAVGLLEKVDLNGIYDLDPLNQILAAAGEEKVQAG